MSKKAEAWMPIWIGDYLADTQRLTTEQHGAYLLLIFDYWRNGPPPDDDDVLRAICKLDMKQWQRHRAILSRMFQVRDGEWHHGRIDRELVSARDNQDRRSSKARAAAEARWGSASSDAPSMPDAIVGECASPSPSPMIEDKPLSSAAKRGSRLSDDWAPSLPYPQNVFALVSQWPPGRADRELDGFRDYWTGATGKGATKLDWDRTWHNRIRDRHDRIMRESGNGNYRNGAGATGTARGNGFLDAARHAANRGGAADDG